MHRHLLVLVALLAALTAALAVPAPPEADEVYVVVAARTLYPGVPISVNDLYAVAVPGDLLSDGVFVSPAHLVNRIPHERILANDIVRQERLAWAAAGQGLAVLVPRGAHGMAFALPAELSPFVHPGHLLDLLVQTAHGVELVAEQVPVVGVGPDAVVLAIAAQNAPAVHDATQRGTMHVSLRRDLDVHPVPRVDRLPAEVVPCGGGCGRARGVHQTCCAASARGSPM